MPAWQVHYGEEDRWKLIHYIGTMFTRAEDPPRAGHNQRQEIAPRCDLFCLTLLIRCPSPE